MAEMWIEGLDKLYVNMQRSIPQIEAAASAGLQKVALNIIADAKANMRTAGHNGGTLVTTGQLRASGKVQKVEGGIDAGFFSQGGDSGYAAYVEYGTRAHWAPVEPMRAWVHKKLRVNGDKAIKRVAYLVNRAMSKRGTRPHPFFAPAVKKNQRAIKRVLNDAIKAVTATINK